MKWLLSLFTFIPFFMLAADDIGRPLGPDPDAGEIAQQFDEWFDRTFGSSPERNSWFDQISSTNFRFNWKSKQAGQIKTHNCSLREACLITYLVRDKVYAGIDTLSIIPFEEFGPHKQRAVSMAIAGNRQNCAAHLLALGHGDDILDKLWNLANEHDSLHAMKPLIEERAQQVLAEHKAGKADA